MLFSQYFLLFQNYLQYIVLAYATNNNEYRRYATNKSENKNNTLEETFPTKKM